MNLRGIDGNEPTEGSNLLNSNEKVQETPAEPNLLQRRRQTRACPPHGLLARVITNGMYMVRMKSEQEGKDKVVIMIDSKIIWLKGQKDVYFSLT